MYLLTEQTYSLETDETDEIVSTETEVIDDSEVIDITITHVIQSLGLEIEVTVYTEIDDNEVSEQTVIVTQILQVIGLGIQVMLETDDVVYSETDEDDEIDDV